ncbi:TetR/AcrR family transcriptional regulator [Tannockella kyphosi]|uniref:TetR/AcrR family transcriptional regulator n=1 Tax=Tannockella kyphosi TaxID=2899121 RepID=UPI0020111476|nr:TetR/AcrR family transcriptional regulator [Tannockella kyphosi]
MKQSDRSKQWIADALLLLIKDNPYHRISITDITTKAGVSRLTFYRNFENKEDILQFHFDRVFSEYISSFQTYEIDLEQALCQCFNFWGNLNSDIKVYLKNDLHILMYRPFGKYVNYVLSKGKYKDFFTPTQQTFIVGGLFSSMLSYVENESKQTPEQATKAVLEILKHK